ncbi:LuxR family transcriptional regulator [Oceanispirochaeta crateris]|uniref:LuxR family transcriptional regulator n=1 Tax=Oceanispirochaeta crateris TaxID=2518645 RepID=A0A5C1QF36_9SPIO|nr:helix-turn-helix transcriptional regulator [Oceanispirochaeta crateris]QEN06703.1 LuxR family transcriptional regulator [Oceanispirochaeta crateris]
MIVLSTYFFIYKILLELTHSKVRIFRIVTTVIVMIQLSRGLIYYYLPNLSAVNTYPFFILIISLYLFYIGYQFITGINLKWNQAVQDLIKRMGIFTLIFAPFSAVIYISLNLFKIKETISLDFVYLAILSMVSVSVVLHYLTTLGTIPSKTSPDDEFLEKYHISPREKEVLELLLKGYSNKQIGEKLFISFTTVRTHVSHIFEKTLVKSRMELVSKILSE